MRILPFSQVYRTDLGVKKPSGIYPEGIVQSMCTKHELVASTTQTRRVDNRYRLDD